MGHLLPFERSGDDSVDFATGVEGRISDQAHQSNVASAVDEGDVALGEQLSKILRRLGTMPDQGRGSIRRRHRSTESAAWQNDR